MLARAAIILVLTAAFAPTAAAQGTQLLPGVTYDRTVSFTPHGVVVVHALAPVLARGTLTGGLEPVTQIERDVSQTATAVGIDGDFVRADGRPSGIWTSVPLTLWSVTRSSLSRSVRVSTARRGCAGCCSGAARS